jgi:hypothetical protein
MKAHWRLVVLIAVAILAALAVTALAARLVVGAAFPVR